MSKNKTKCSGPLIGEGVKTPKGVPSKYAPALEFEVLYFDRFCTGPREKNDFIIDYVVFKERIINYAVFRATIVLTTTLFHISFEPEFELLCFFIEYFRVIFHAMLINCRLEIVNKNLKI